VHSKKASLSIVCVKFENVNKDKLLHPEKHDCGISPMIVFLKLTDSTEALMKELTPIDKSVLGNMKFVTPLLENAKSLILLT